MVHVRPAVGGIPIGIFFQKSSIEPVKAAGRPDVERAIADLLDGADARQRQKETEVIGEIWIGTGDRLAGRQVLGLQLRAVGGKDKAGFRSGRPGLAFNAVRNFETSPDGLTRM